MTQDSKNDLLLEFDTNDLSPGQIRLIRNYYSTLLDILKTDQEQGYFEGAADLLRITAALIKEAPFADHSKKSHQALEYAMETLQERIQIAKVDFYDN
ncbi:MAG: hypothetical protein DRQ88_09455 [Epsilonproteobacteria bacterium]|nr:MAG: hypothetical protein DRQ89_10175 [Campylobacterota bacterium]RLA65345.1 MAG: hypothetical protein DRQ88_09455 [Campylobacterota bacterium]